MGNAAEHKRLEREVIQAGHELDRAVHTVEQQRDAPTVSPSTGETWTWAQCPDCTARFYSPGSEDRPVPEHQCDHEEERS